jgi:hypothetical protein
MSLATSVEITGLKQAMTELSKMEQVSTLQGSSKD